MGYDLHITRKPEWSDEDGTEITRDDWLNYVRNDNEMRLARDVVVENGEGEQISLHEDTLAVWLKWPGRKEGKSEAMLWHTDGNIVSKNPDTEMVQKMFLIAIDLDAKVQGDDGEYYNSIGEVERPEGKDSKPWWKFW